MAKNIFISYSRRETGFVDQLADDLLKQDYTIWLDYRNLVPGVPWQQQIFDGLDNADIILLVVSKASIASSHVRDEWIRELNNKQIILAVFEAVELPPELVDLPWIDFRKNYKKGIAQLTDVIENPPTEIPPIPQKGFKPPTVVWVAFTLSLIAAGLAIFLNYWTLVIPFFIVPLPYYLLKREYKFTQVTIALAVMAFTLDPSASLLGYRPYPINLFLWQGLFPVILLGLIYLLNHKSIQRWVKPVGLRVFRKKKIKIDNPTPSHTVNFFIDYAPEDQKIAHTLSQTLSQYGHQLVENATDSDVNFVLISAYKAETTINPDNQVVIPMILQMRDNIAENLSRMQWIDFRGGLKNLKEMAHFLPEPQKLLEALGTIPTGNQEITPLIVQVTTYWLYALLALGVGVWGPYAMTVYRQPEFEFYGLPIFLFVIITATFIGISLRFLQLLNHRNQWLNTIWKAIASLSAVYIFRFISLSLGFTAFQTNGIFEFTDAEIEMDPIELFEANAMNFRLMAPFAWSWVFWIGLGVIAILYFVRKKELHHWLPAKTGNQKRQ